jgi:hypothetical protein
MYCHKSTLAHQHLTSITLMQQPIKGFKTSCCYLQQLKHVCSSSRLLYLETMQVLFTVNNRNGNMRQNYHNVFREEILLQVRTIWP